MQHYQAMLMARSINAIVLSPIYIYGMAPLDFDDSFYVIFLTDPACSLDCDTHIEAEGYVSRVEHTRFEICCEFVGVLVSPIGSTTHLKALEGPYSIVLPKCKACTKSCCHVIVRSTRSNAKAMHAIVEHAIAREAIPIIHLNTVESLGQESARKGNNNTTTTPIIEPVATSTTSPKVLSSAITPTRTLAMTTTNRIPKTRRNK